MLSRLRTRAAQGFLKRHRCGISELQTIAKIQTRPSSRQTKIEKIVLDSIRATGPISFATYMQLCLLHPTEGYYMKASNPVFGTRGDFITSPEISQVFGEIVALWLLSQCPSSEQDHSAEPAKAPFRLVELGPGRGTLMEDMLRVVSHFPSTRSALRHVHLIEPSRVLRVVQQIRLMPWAEKTSCEITWHDSVDELTRHTDTFTMLVAHEFFDALPIHILQRTGKCWHEVLISSTTSAQNRVSISPSPPNEVRLDQEGPSPSLCSVLSPSPTSNSAYLSACSSRFDALPEGSRLEVSPLAGRTAGKVGELLGTSEGEGGHGCALIIDYGDEHSFGNSFRAFKDHKIVDPFYLPGECDLTANVDFAYLKEAIGGLAQTHGPVTQRDFLYRMGLPLRVSLLARHARSEDRKTAIERAGLRLVDPLGMGTQYRVLGVTNLPRRSQLEPVWPFVEASKP